MGAYSHCNYSVAFSLPTHFILTLYVIRAYALQIALTIDKKHLWKHLTNDIVTEHYIHHGDHG